MKKIVSIGLLIILFDSALYVMSTLNNPESLSSINWVHYHNYKEIVTILFELNQTYPDIVEVFSIGKSWLNFNIYALRLTNESDQKPKPEVFFVGYHHAREQITSELTLYFAVYAATNFGSNQTITDLLNKSKIYVVVALNVDGFDLFEKNGYQRYNAHDVDLNRNYDYAWKDGGLSPFSEPETQAVRDFVLEHHFKYAISFHSGAELILYPWGCTRDPPPDEAEFLEISKGLSRVTGGTLYMQSSHAYITYGTWDDWMYGVTGVFALTVEIFYCPPPTISRPHGGRPGMHPTPDAVTDPMPYSYAESTFELKYMYNPVSEIIEAVVLRWLPVFFYVTNRTINDVIVDS